MSRGATGDVISPLVPHLALLIQLLKQVAYFNELQLGSIVIKL